ncbi:YcaO-like family protein [Auraticoccus monumenti]|uniref:YcaO-like family protein n=1 Tax=Auraticoccus monumenti TaxID=675864 RepID=UPI0012FB4D44|nr:YcaO-like family protein [Auraticoccus monumenti]
MTSAEPDAQTLIDLYRSALAPIGELVELRLDGLDRLGVPVTSCSLVVDGRTAHAGNGYGRTVEAAVLSGLGELAEGAFAARHVARLRPSAVRASRRRLVAREGADRVVDPRTLCLPVGSPWTEELELSWVPLERVPDGESVWVPLEYVASEVGELDGGTPLITPITNGLGAGLDDSRPLLHGLLELLQRHTNATRFRALDHLSPEIDQATLPQELTTLVDAFRDLGVEPVLKHAGTELGVVSTYVMGVDASPSQAILVTGCGEAAAPDAVESLTKALLEYANSRARKAFCFGDPERARAIAPEGYWSALGSGAGEARAHEALTAWAGLGTAGLTALTAPDRSRTVAFSDVTVEPVPGPGVEEQLQHVLGHLAADDLTHDVLTARSRHGDVVVAKTVVTGLEAETLSYGRVGELGARRLLATDLDLVRRQPSGTERHSERVVLTPEAEERLGGPVWWSPTDADRVLGPLYPLYREPPRHSVAVV